MNSDKTETLTKWDKIIRPRNGWFDVNPGELWQYRDLIALFVWRDFVSVYKQTILGPLWYIIQPLLTTVVFTIVFGKVAHLSTDGVPPFLFYLLGIIGWRYFSDCLLSTSNTFVGNAHIFGKVYFPRLTVPVSIVISNLFALGIQLFLFCGFLLYYRLNDAVLNLQSTLLLLPILVLQMAALSLGFGIIVSSMTTRYRDLSHLVGFGVQLWMYATPIVYPASSLPEKWRWILILNPMAPVIETLRHAFLGSGSFNPGAWLGSVAVTCLVLFVAVVLFSKVEKSVMDTV